MTHFAGRGGRENCRKVGEVWRAWRPWALLFAAHAATNRSAVASREDGGGEPPMEAAAALKQLKFSEFPLRDFSRLRKDSSVCGVKVQ